MRFKVKEGPSHLVGMKGYITPDRTCTDSGGMGFQWLLFGNTNYVEEFFPQQANKGPVVTHCSQAPLCC